MATYEDVYTSWREDPEGFWMSASRSIDWDRAPEVALDRSRKPIPTWFPDGRLNTCFNAVDRHVRDGRAEQTALIYDSPVTNTVLRYSYRELRDEVAALAGALRALVVGAKQRTGRIAPVDQLREAGEIHVVAVHPAQRAALFLDLQQADDVGLARLRQ